MASTVHDVLASDPERAVSHESSAAGRSNAPWLAAEATVGEEDPHRYLLLLRFTLVNIVGFALLSAAWVSGYVDQILAADGTKLSVVIFAVFLGGLAICTAKVVQTSRELNAVRSFSPRVRSFAAGYLHKLRGQSDQARSLLAGALRLKLSHRIAVVKHIAGVLVILGLVGTVVGFIIALSGVDPAKASDFDSISPMVSTLIQGMSTALYTTLVGAVLNIWLMINYRLLATGTVNLITQLIEFGERHGRA